MKKKMVTPIVKAAAELAGVSRQELTTALGLGMPQALTNKYNRDSFSSRDLVKIASACKYRLAFVDESGRAVLTFPEIIKTEEEEN